MSTKVKVECKVVDSTPSTSRLSSISSTGEKGASMLGEFTDGKKERYVNIQVLRIPGGSNEKLGIDEIKFEENKFIVKSVNKEPVGLRGTLPGKWGKKYTAARHGITEETVITEINGETPTVPNDVDPRTAFLNQAFKGAKDEITHTISLKVKDNFKKDKNKRRWKIIRFFLPEDQEKGFNLIGTSVNSYPFIDKVNSDSPAEKAGLGTDKKIPTEVKYMAFQPMREIQGIHYALSSGGDIGWGQDGSEKAGYFYGGSIAGPAEIMISASSTPWAEGVGVDSRVTNAKPAIGSGSRPIDIFKNTPPPLGALWVGQKKEEKVEAATKIQAHFRGTRDRKNLAKPLSDANEKNKKALLNQKIKNADAILNEKKEKKLSAATNIQRVHRGHQGRKKAELIKENQRREKELREKAAAAAASSSDSSSEEEEGMGGGGQKGGGWVTTSDMRGVVPDPIEDAFKLLKASSTHKWELTDEDDKNNKIIIWNKKTMFPIIRMNAKTGSRGSTFPMGWPQPQTWDELKELKSYDLKSATNNALTVSQVMEQMDNFITAVKTGGVVTLVVTDLNLGPINSGNSNQSGGMRNRRKRNIRTLVRKKGTRRKINRRKGTGRKGTRHKRTRHKGTGHKSNRRKRTRHKGTRRKGTRRN